MVMTALEPFQWLSVRTLPGGALVVWPETLSRTPWLINKSAEGPRLKTDLRKKEMAKANYDLIPFAPSAP